ncbi:MAG: zinc finger domain-containing protein [Candidatus Acidiferrales bacterium]
MKLKLLTSKQLSSVPCPTCGARIGRSCVLHSGAPRPAAHVDRRHSAAKAMERERF